MNEPQPIEKQIPEFLHIMEVALRSGYSLMQALEMVTKDMNGVLAAEAQQVIDEIKAGTTLPTAFDHWLERRPGRRLDLVVAAVHAQLEAGGNLANKFQFLAQLMPYLKHG